MNDEVVYDLRTEPVTTQAPTRYVAQRTPELPWAGAVPRGDLTRQRAEHERRQALTTELAGQREEIAYLRSRVEAQGKKIAQLQHTVRFLLEERRQGTRTSS